MKINFSLPFFNNNLKINNLFYVLSKERTEWFRVPVNFYSFTGNFPFCYWTGHYNDTNTHFEYSDINNLYKNAKLPMMFDCTNYNLKKSDYNDILGNIILKENSTGANIIEVSTIETLKYVKENYPYYNYAFYCDSICYNDTFIEKLLEIGVRYIRINSELLDVNSKYNKNIELILNHSCGVNCEKNSLCTMNNQDNIYNYNNSDIFRECPNRKIYGQDFNQNLEYVINKYLPLGINHFSLSPPHSKKEYIDFLIKFFINEKYQVEVYKNIREEELYD